MKISPEYLDRRKKILLAATTIALGAAALRRSRSSGDRTYDVSFWPSSELVFADIISDSKKLAGRLASKVIKNEYGEVVDVEPPDEDELAISEERLVIYEQEIIQGEWLGVKPETE